MAVLTLTVDEAAVDPERVIVSFAVLVPELPSPIDTSFTESVVSADLVVKVYVLLQADACPASPMDLTRQKSFVVPGRSFTQSKPSMEAPLRMMDAWSNDAAVATSTSYPLAVPPHVRHGDSLTPVALFAGVLRLGDGGVAIVGG